MEEYNNKQNILFSFKYLTNNSKHGIKGGSKNKKAIESLFEKLKEISDLSWIKLFNENKKTGIETITISKTNISKILTDNDILSYDDKIIVIRFGNGKYRILGHKMDKDNTFYIIAFDWDFTAYNHS